MYAYYRIYKKALEPKKLLEDSIKNFPFKFFMLVLIALFMLNVYTQKKIRAFEDFYVLDTDLLLEEPAPEPDEVPEDISFIVLVGGKEVNFYYYYYVFSKDGSSLYAKTKVSDPYVEGETYKLQSYTTNTATYNRTDGEGMIKFYNITLEGGRAIRYTLWGDTTKFVKLTHHEVIF